MKKVWAAVALVTLVSACAVGPRYVRPDLKLPDRYRFSADPAPGAAAGTDAGFGEMQWWDLYQDPHLRDLIRIALTENADVRIAAARVEEARALAGSTRLQLVPQISVQAAAQRSKASNDELKAAGLSRFGNLFDAEGTLSYELDFWGRLRRLDQAARADLLASEYAKRAVLVGLVSDVATTYFELVTLKREVAISRRTVDTRLKLVELTRAKHERGVISGLDVAAAEAQLAVARVAIPQQELSLARTEHHLSVLLGRYPQSFDIPEQDLVAAIAPVPPAGLPATLLERRPDVQQSEAELIGANARLGAAEAALFPTLTLTGALGGISTDLSRLFTPETAAWSASAGLLQPLLDPQRSIYTKRAADARRAQALNGYAQTVQRALQEVADALIARTKQAEIESAQRDQVEALRRASTIAHARYDVGTASYVDVTNADRDLFGAELALVTANQDNLLATVQLYRALGGGWQLETARGAAPPGGAPPGGAPPKAQEGK